MYHLTITGDWNTLPGLHLLGQLRGHVMFCSNSFENELIFTNWNIVYQKGRTIEKRVMKRHSLRIPHSELPGECLHGFIYWTPISGTPSRLQTGKEVLLRTLRWRTVSLIQRHPSSRDNRQAKAKWQCDGFSAVNEGCFGNTGKAVRCRRGFPVGVMRIWMEAMMALENSYRLSGPRSSTINQ